MVPFSKDKVSTRAHGFGAKVNTSVHGLNEAWITELMTFDFEYYEVHKDN